MRARAQKTVTLADTITQHYFSYNEIEALEDHARARTGHESLGESAWRDLAHPAPDSVGFLVPGRAYVRTGHATLTAFQAGLVGGLRRSRDRRGTGISIS